MDQQQLLALASISDADFDVAPFGCVMVDKSGTIERYNRYESELAHLSPDRAVGRNFFHDVAPCTARRAFEGRFLEFVALGDVVSDSFAYFFPFAHGDANVLVTFVKLAARSSFLIVVQRVDEEIADPLKDIYSVIDPD